MMRSLTLLTALGLSLDAAAQDAPAPATEMTQWEGVYTRSGKTIKTGEWLGIGGGVGVLAGGTMLLAGGAGAAAGLGSGDGDAVETGAGVAVGGAAVGIVGYTVFAAGPAVMAGGVMRQSKAVRQVNPEAPYPWLGASSWVLWTAGFSSAFTNPPTGILLLAGSYITSGLQKGKNRMYWDARTKAAYEESERSSFALSVAPMASTDLNGMMLYGTF